MPPWCRRCASPAAGLDGHPVAATDPAMQVHDHLADLSGAIDTIRDEFLAYRRQGDMLAASFPCA